MKQFTFFLVLIFAVSACKSVDKLYQEGNYKQILSKLEGKAKKGNLDRKEKGMLVKAMNKYAEEINREVLESLNSSRPSEWTKAKKKLEKLEDSFDEVNNYSQVRSDDLIPSRIDELYPQLNTKLYNFTIDEYDEDIANYDRTGNRDYAQRAYGHAGRLYNYGGDIETIELLEIQAIDLGHRVTYVDVDGPIGYGFTFKNYFERELELNNDVFNTFVEFRNLSDIDYRLSIEVDITRADTDRSTRQDRYTDKVVDYYDNVIDTSTNQTNQIPVYKDVEAVVETAEVTRYVEGEYDYDIWDIRNNRRFDYGGERHRIEDSQIVYTLISGDEDAVPSNIDLSTRSINSRSDYEDLLKELYRVLVDDFNNDVDIKARLH